MATAVHQELLRRADQALDQARKANEAETQLKILQSSQDKLVNIVQSVEKRHEVEPVDMTVQYNKGCL